MLGGLFDGYLYARARVAGTRLGLAGLASATALACAALSVGGCGGVLSPDLFIVYRAGNAPGAKLTVLVNEEGAVECNPDPSHPVIYHLSDSRIIEARTIQEDLHDPASRNESLPAEKGSVLSYYVRDQDGSVRFADNSPSQPAVTRKLALFVLNVAQTVCRLPQQGA
ncbi:MAG TPA: hypothetical protein VIG42_03840 [Solirubrobacteraceae bacterium]|jgi:hypothetical protein